MKKQSIITARVTHEIKETIQSLADRDERTLAWMIRKLILEALEARSLLKRDAVHAEAGEHDSRAKTVSTDMIREKIAAYGLGDEGDADWIMQKRMLFLTIPGLQADAYP
jgi:predicted transcriptional regulator